MAEAVSSRGRFQFLSEILPDFPGAAWIVILDRKWFFSGDKDISRLSKPHPSSYRLAYKIQRGV